MIEWFTALSAGNWLMVALAICLIGLGVILVIGAGAAAFIEPTAAIVVLVLAVGAVVGGIVIFLNIDPPSPSDDEIADYNAAASNYWMERERLDGLLGRADTLAGQSGRARLTTSCLAIFYTGPPFPEQDAAAVHARAFANIGADCEQIIDPGNDAGDAPDIVLHLSLSAARHGPADARFHFQEDNTIAGLLDVPPPVALIPQNEIEGVNDDDLKELTRRLQALTVALIEMNATATAIVDGLIAGVRDNEAANLKYITSIVSSDAGARQRNLAYALTLANASPLSVGENAPAPVR